MKTTFSLFRLLLSVIMMGTSAFAARPAFLPALPPASKAPADYTADDVLGIASTPSAEFPEGHPFAESWDGLKTKWPGAAKSESIDALVGIVLRSPAAATPATTPVDTDQAMAQGDLAGAWLDVTWIMRHVMTIDASAKAVALLRVVAAQSDPVKKKRVAAFAADMFPELLDMRLLALKKDALDDSTVVSVLREEEARAIHFTARRDARRDLVPLLTSYLKMDVDSKPFFTGSEAEGCTALKNWMTAHWSEIEKVSQALRSVASREMPPDMGVVTWAKESGKPGEPGSKMELPPNNEPWAKEPIKLTEDGIELYGRILFESEGERYTVLDKKTSTLLVPDGAVLAVIKRYYSIGYYEGDIGIEKGGKIEKIPKIYFTLTKDGLEFHRPSADGKYSGEKVTGKVGFPVP